MSGHLELSITRRRCSSFSRFFFVSLQVMLIFSAGIILYGGLYATRETTFLMTLPVRNSRLVFYRFQEALFFSSWGFFLLASPMMVAYGLVVAAPWYYYAYLPVMVVSFAYIPCAVGAIACLLLISRLPHLRRIVVGLLAVFVIGAALLFHLAHAEYQQRRSSWRRMVQRNVPSL